MVEPSAGTGAFSDLLPACRLAFDVEPRGEHIVKADYLKIEIRSARKIAVIGNPPFGSNASLAIRFFNHSAMQADVVALIMPLSIMKASMINRLDPDFHLLHEETVETNAFLLEAIPYDVPTVFQIWERRTYRRVLRAVEFRHSDFDFTTKDKADFAIQRVGARAGRVHHDLTASASSHYFIRGDVERTMRRLEPSFRRAAADVAGNPSLAKSEIVALYRQQAEAPAHLPLTGDAGDPGRLEDHRRRRWSRRLRHRRREPWRAGIPCTDWFGGTDRSRLEPGRLARRRTRSPRRGLHARREAQRRVALESRRYR
ncbi:MAG: hypothetical protein ACRYG4_15300 [Janthinobacterium lividum]